MNESVVVKYRTQKSYCRCCGQKLQEVKTSGIREFEFNKRSTMDYADWKLIVNEYYEDDFPVMSEEFVYETISFFATDSDDKIIIEKTEIEKVKQFIVNQVKS